MILAIGELLSDMVGTTENNTLSFKAFAGGAPFNLAVNAKRQGATVGFVGRVGNDVIGRFLLEETKKAGFDSADIQIDNVRNTTLAFVSLVDGERDFSFYRHDTADFNLDFDKIDDDVEEIKKDDILEENFFKNKEKIEKELFEEFNDSKYEKVKEDVVDEVEDIDNTKLPKISIDEYMKNFNEDKLDKVDSFFGNDDVFPSIPM